MLLSNILLKRPVLFFFKPQSPEAAKAPEHHVPDKLKSCRPTANLRVVQYCRDS